jgi:Fe2+ or Zn2+ uptake regulation protein
MTNITRPLTLVEEYTLIVTQRTRRGRSSTLIHTAVQDEIGSVTQRTVQRALVALARRGLIRRSGATNSPYTEWSYNRGQHDNKQQSTTPPGPVTGRLAVHGS